MIERQVQAGALITLCLLIFTTTIEAAEVASAAALIAPRPPGWRWAVDPLPVRRPQPSLVGSTGYGALLTTATLQQGHYSAPFHGDCRGLFDGEPLSSVLGFNGHPLPSSNLVLEGRGATRARHAWATPEGHRVNALLGALYGLANGLAVHAAWQVERHDLVRDNGASGLDDRLSARVTYAFQTAMVAPPPPPPSLPPSPPPPVAPPERRIERILLQSVHFTFDQARLTPLGQRVWNETAQKLQKSPTLLVTIEGHSEAIGTALDHLGLGKRPAEVVKAYLVRQHQLDPTRMTTLRDGETRPIADHQTQQGRALDRRVALTVLIRQV